MASDDVALELFRTLLKVESMSHSYHPELGVHTWHFKFFNGVSLSVSESSIAVLHYRHSTMAIERVYTRLHEVAMDISGEII